MVSRYELNGPESNPGGEARLSAPVQTSPEAHQASWAMVTGFLSGKQRGRGVALTTHPQMASRL